MRAGVAVNPHTSVQLLNDIIADVDLICLMSVNPGFGGQKFIENTYRKITDLKEIILKHNSKALIEIDGGVDFSNYKKLIQCGADVLVAGNTVFSNENPTKAIAQLKQLD
jgi:ribulose-phosphate 3-epimerase